MMAMQAAQQAALATNSNAASRRSDGCVQVPRRLLSGRLPLMLVVQLIYFVGMAEVSLQPTSAVGAPRRGQRRRVRNLLKLFVLGICLFIGFFIVAIVFGIIAAILIGALMMASPTLLFVVGGLVYLAILVVIYPLMFSSNYLVWKDMLGDTSPPSLTL
jgi:hypothetical protein